MDILIIVKLWSIFRYRTRKCFKYDKSIEVILDGGVIEAIDERYLSQIKIAAMKNSFADIYALS